MKRILVLLAAMTLLGFSLAYALEEDRRPGHYTGYGNNHQKPPAKPPVKVDVRQQQQQGQVQGLESAPVTEQTVNDPRDFLPAPGFMWLPDGMQPYKPDGWISSPGRWVPTRLTFAEADACRRPSISDSWDGYSPALITAEKKDRTIELVYPQLQKDSKAPTGRFLGTARAQNGDDPPFITVVCEAAFRAMEEGVQVGEVTFAVKGDSRYFGISLGPSVAASVIPPAAQNSPYGVSGAIGGGIGFSSTKVKGELTVDITGFAKPFTPVDVPAPTKKK